MLKIKTGYREDQFIIIENEEAHKAYYLFLHPEGRAIFNNGVALIGQSIQGIEPAYNEMMGWNPTHKPTGDDWSDIRRSGIDSEMKKVMEGAKTVSMLMEKDKSLGLKKLSEVVLLLN